MGVLLVGRCQLRMSPILPDPVSERGGFSLGVDLKVIHAVSILYPFTGINPELVCCVVLEGRYSQGGLVRLAILSL